MANETNNKKPLRRSDEIYNSIEEAIRVGTFPSGTRLPSETALATDFGVSRPTVREALARLREDGLIKSRQGSGAYVQSAPSPVKQIAPLASIDDLKKCFEYRIGLESEAARLAALHRNNQDLERLKSLFEAMDRANSSGETGMEEDYAFHLAVAKASGNRFIVAGLEQVRPHIAQGMTINRTLSLESPESRLSTVQAEHRNIIDNLEQKNPADAANAMATHLRNAMIRFLGE